LGSPPGGLTNKRLFYCADSRHSVLLSVHRSLPRCLSPCLSVECRTGWMQLAVMCCSSLRCAVWQPHECSFNCPPSEAYTMSYQPFVKQLMPLPEATGFCSRGRSLSPCSIFEDQRGFSIARFCISVGLSPGVPLSVLSINVQIEKLQRASVYVVRPATSREQLVRPKREKMAGNYACNLLPVPSSSRISVA
jgi:hypothetical protein